MCEGGVCFHLCDGLSSRVRGAGLGCFTVSFLVSLYYNTVLVWVLWYLLNSFQQPLPWSTCPPNINRTGEGHRREHGVWGWEPGSGPQALALLLHSRPQVPWPAPHNQNWLPVGGDGTGLGAVVFGQ